MSERLLTKGRPNPHSTSDNADFLPHDSNADLSLFRNEIADSYNFAVRLYQQAQYAQAARLFFLVSLAQPLNPVILAAQGKCRKMMKEFNTAASLFRTAWLLDESSPEYALHAVECLLLSGDRTEAVVLLELLLANEGFLQQHSQLYAKAKAWSELITTEKRG